MLWFYIEFWAQQCYNQEIILHYPKQNKNKNSLELRRLLPKKNVCHAHMYSIV